jgi:hypothetical protein
MAEGNRMSTNEGAPGLTRTPVHSPQIARHGGLGDVEAQHEQFAVDPWRTPEKARPPGRASFARVTSRWAIKLKSSRMSADFNRS